MHALTCTCKFCVYCICIANTYWMICEYRPLSCTCLSPTALTFLKWIARVGFCHFQPFLGCSKWQTPLRHILKIICQSDNIIINSLIQCLSITVQVEMIATCVCFKKLQHSVISCIYLLLTKFEGRTVRYRPSFPPMIMAQALKTRIRTLQYRPRKTSLVRYL